MHTDDDIFESLNIGDKGRPAPGKNAKKEPEQANAPTGRPQATRQGTASEDYQSRGSGRDDTIIFEDLDMEERILSSALDETDPKKKLAYGKKTQKREYDDPFYGEPLERDRYGLNGSGSGNGGGKGGRRKDDFFSPESGGRHIPKELNTADSSIDRKKVKKEKEKKKQSRLKKIIIAAVVELFTLLAIFAYGYFLRSWNLIQRADVKLEVVENNNLSVEKKEEMAKGYWNIAIFGVDSRDDNLVARGLNSDVIMIASINRENGDIKLVSVFRDTYLNVSEKNSYNKINSAYAMGGPEQALAALNKNLDLNIVDYVAFNWKAVADGINILGGVDGISLSRAELYYINAYITETVNVTGIGSHQLQNTGEQHLDGVQAVAYARLRYMDNDFARTERQRNVIKACFAKAKQADFSVLNNIMVTCFPQVATNINFNDIVAMAQNITRYNIADTGGFPWSRGDAVIKGKGDCVIPTTLESNVIKLHEFLFGDAAYTPSDAVLNISAKIKEDSSLYKEGRVIESVATDGGVIQQPKVPATVGRDDDEEDEEVDVTIGVDDNGNYIYPTDENGDYVIPTDADGDIIYPTDEDGNIIRESSMNARPTDLAGDTLAPGEYDPDESDVDEGPINNGREPGETRPTQTGTGNGTSTRPGESQSTSHTETTGSTNSTTGPTQTDTPATPSPGPTGQSGSGIISEDGPGSLSPGQTDGPGGSGETNGSGTGSQSPGSGGVITDTDGPGSSGNSQGNTSGTSAVITDGPID